MTPRVPSGSFVDLYGLWIERLTDVSAGARLEVCDKVRQPFGLVHGGVYASIAEALATLGTIEGIAPGRIAVGLSNNTSFIRPVRGAPHAEAHVRHRGSTTWLWDVQVHDDERLCAMTRMTIAVRPPRDRGSS